PIEELPQDRYMHDKDSAKVAFDQVLNTYTAPLFLADQEYALVGLDLQLPGGLSGRYHPDRLENSIEFKQDGSLRTDPPLLVANSQDFERNNFKVTPICPKW